MSKVNGNTKIIIGGQEKGRNSRWVKSLLFLCVRVCVREYVSIGYERNETTIKVPSNNNHILNKHCASFSFLPSFIPSILCLILQILLKKKKIKRRRRRRMNESAIHKAKKYINKHPFSLFFFFLQSQKKKKMKTNCLVSKCLGVWVSGCVSVSVSKYNTIDH